jgi:RHS repeat-associated protein
VTHVDARGVVCATRAVGDASAADAWTRQVLDATGQARAVVDARGNVAFTYVRDLRGRVVAQASVDAGPTWAVTDGYDRAVQSWDARGFAVTRGFDVADRPTTVHVTGGDGVTAMDAVVETYLYGDQAADRAAAVAANTVGRLVEVKDGAGVVSVSAYDPLGAVRAQGRRLRATVDEAPDWRGAEALESEVLTTVARTDALGREVWTALVDGTVRASTYARGGALASVRVTTPDGALVEAPIVEGLTRDAHGRVVAATLGNGVGQTWAYDPASGRLVAQDAVRGTRAYQGLRCTYDPDGKLVRMLDVAQDGPGALVPGAVSARRDFGYDAHGRLVEATGRVHQALLPHDGPTTAGCVHGARHLSLNNGAALERYTQRFSYDAGGNLTRVQHAGTTASWATDYWVAAGSNRSTAAEDGNGVPVVDPAGMFDAGGNLRELWHLRAMGWSWRGCLTHATTVARPSGPVDDGERYAYGADRVRVRKVATRLVVGGAEPVVETREVVYCGGGQERVRVARNGTLVLERWTTHVSDGDRRVAVIDRHVVDTLANEVDAIGPARVRYHLTTPQGSTAVELDEAGLLVSYEEYLPHGGSAFIAGDDVREVARRDVRYAGKERDRATGLDAYPQRYYAPWLGRWLSPDPIGPKDGLNLYAFVGGDPVGHVDPEGTERRPAVTYADASTASPESFEDQLRRAAEARRVVVNVVMGDTADTAPQSSAAPLVPSRPNASPHRRQDRATPHTDAQVMTAGDELFRNDPVLARASALRSDPIPTSAAEPTAATFGDVIIAAVGRDVLAAAAGRRALHALNERGIDTTGFDVDAYTRGLDPFSAGAAVREAAEQMALNSGQKIIDYGWANGIARNQVRISGGFQAVGGTLMMAAGAAIAAVPGGQVVGLAVAALGADQVAAGVSKVVTNGQVESNLHNGLEAAGGKEFADNGEAAITTVIPVAGEYAVLNRMGLWGRPWAVPRPGSGAPAERGGLDGDATRASPSNGKTGERSPELQQALERADDLAPHADVLSTQWQQHSQAERLEGLPADAARARQAASAAAHGADRGFLNLDPVTP